MNKKIIVSKSNLVIGLIMALLFFGAFVFFLVYGLIDGLSGSELAEVILISAWFFCMSIIFVAVANRGACKIWIEDGMVKRKGFFWGCEKECKIEDIKKVEIKMVHRMGECYCIIDEPDWKTNSLCIDRYLHFKKNKKTTEFLKSFWQGEIKKAF